MSTHLHHAALALALVAGTGAAQAQTVITREVTTEPVETIVERGPTGTVITRRPLDMTVPRAPLTLQDETAVTVPVEPIVRSRETVGSSVVTTSSSSDAVATRRIAGQRAVAPPRSRAATTQRQVGVSAKAQPVRKPAPRPAVGTARATAGVATAPRIAAAPPPLTAAQRSTIYRAVVEEPVVPRTVITEPVAASTFAAPVVTAPAVREEVVTERVVTPAAPFIRERIVTRPLAVETVGAAPIVTERVVATPASIDLTIGSRVPATVPLYALPPTLGVQIPSVRSYRYAIVDDRVLLVDPVTGVVVAELDQ
jgi:Protein of unknown function (DUF1236)